MTYFENFQKSDYLFDDDVIRSVTNISKYAALFSRPLDNFTFYTFYQLKEDERLDNVSETLYGTPDFYWTIPLVNANLVNTWKNYFKGTRDFESFIKRKYPGLALFAHESTPVAGNFEEGEIVAFDIENVCRIIRKYPNQNYIHVELLNDNDFNPLDLGDVWVLLTGLWNERPQNIWSDSDVWKDNTLQLINPSAQSIEIESFRPMHLAPAYFLDADNNRVTWKSQAEKFPVTWRDVERQRNEEFSRIKVIRPEFITEIAEEFEKRIKL